MLYFITSSLYYYYNTYYYYILKASPTQLSNDQYVHNFEGK